MESKNPNNQEREQGYSRREQELIRQFIEYRLAQNEILEYEEFDDYEVPLPSKLPILTKPGVTLKYRTMCFSMASIRLFLGCQHILPILNRKKKRLSVIPLKEEEASSIMWARRRDSDGKWYNREITIPDIVDDIFDLMDWDRDLRYRAPGHIADSPRGLIIIYELSEASMYPRGMTEYTDPETGEVKKHRKLYYPDEFKGRLGRSYNDYIALHQLSMFDDLSESDHAGTSDSSPNSSPASEGT